MPEPDGAARAAMVDGLRSKGVLHDDEVERALRLIPRHHFVEGVTVERAYDDTAIATKADRDGMAISSLSQPTMVAAMLEMLQLRAGHRVLEIGAGTGYNAALVASIIGPGGHLVTVELEPDLATSAERRLRDHGFDNVRVVTGDGAAGWPDGAPYDRIIVTTGAPSIADAWTDQLEEGGRLVVPVVDADGTGLVHCLVKRDHELDEVSALPCGFLPMRPKPMRPD